MTVKMVRVGMIVLCFCFAAQVWAQEKQGEEKKKKPKKPLILSLEELVVVGTRGERKLRSLSDTVSVISRSDIEVAHAVTVDEFLDSVPGVNIQGAGHYGDKVTLNFRGLQGRYGAQRVLVLIDGRPANEEYMGDFDFRFVPVEAIERIEVCKGPASALYGGLAIGGVINIVTKNPRKKKAGTFSASLGSHNSRQYTAAISTGGKTLASLFTGSGFATDGYLKNSDGSNQDWENGRLFVKVVRSLGQRSVLTFSTGAAYGTGHEENFKLHQVNDFQYLSLETPLGKGTKKKLEVRAFRNGTYQERGWTFGVDSRYHQYTAGAQGQYTQELSEQNILTSGVELKTQRANVGALAGHIEEQITEAALYAQEEIESGKLKLTLGLRLDLNDEFGSQVSPRAGITLEAAKDTVLRLSGGKAFRPPTISDLYLPPTPYDPPDIYAGNPDLKPEILWSGELGVRHKMRIAGKQVSIDAALYRSRGIDFFDYMPVTEPVVTHRPQNFSAVNILGAEIEVAAILSSGLKASLGYTYTDARYARYEPDPAIEHNRVEDIPQHSGSTALTYHSREGHTASVMLRIVGDRYTDHENIMANKLHSFAVLGVGGTAKLSDHTRAFARIDNMTDKKYREVAGKVQPGRTFTIGMSLVF